MDMMDSSSNWPDPLRAIRKTVIGELLKGKESATKLQTILQKAQEEVGGPIVPAEELAQQISTSFIQSLSILDACGCGVNETTQVDGVVKVSSGERRSKASDHSKKRSGGKDRRGCYRRRNISQSWITVSATTEDGHAWRKYGQKEILNTKFPRCYFRCTHKHDQACKATKQVQRIKEDPLMYQTTYFGHHTCQDTMMRAPQIILDSDPMESCLLSFEAKTPTKQDPRFPNFAMITTTAHQELKDETLSDASDNKSCLDSSMFQDPVTSESSGRPAKVKSPHDGAHHEEVVSSGRSCSSTPLHDNLDMETFTTGFGDIDHVYFNDMEYFQTLP